MQERSLKIYKPKDLDGLQNVEKLQHDTKEECERLVKETKLKCVQIEKETHDKALADVHGEQLKLFEQSFKKVDHFFNQAQENIQSILQVIFDKLRIEQDKIHTLSQLLFTEIEKLKMKSLKFTIYANAEVMPNLQGRVKDEYANQEHLTFDFDIKTELENEECLVESEYVMARIHVKDFFEKVSEIIKNN